MYTFAPLIDVNTKVVYQWTMTDSHGQQVIKSVPRVSWKPASDWSQEELYEFFTTTPVAIEPIEPVVPEPVVEPEPDIEPEFDSESEIDPDYNEEEPNSTIF